MAYSSTQSSLQHVLLRTHWYVFALMATHTKEQVERGVKILKEVFVEEGVIK